MGVNYQGMSGVIGGVGLLLGGGLLLQHAQQAAMVQEALQLLMSGIACSTAAPYSCSTACTA